MGRPKADLSYYGPFGAFPIPPPVPPDPNYLPIVPTASLISLGNLAIWALAQARVAAMVSLYTSFYQPLPTSTLADFTSPIAPGLLPQPLPPATPLGIDPFGNADWTFGPITWTAAGGGLPTPAWGYYVWCTDPITGMATLLWAQRFVTSFVFNVAGNKLTVPLYLSLGG